MEIKNTGINITTLLCLFFCFFTSSLAQSNTKILPPIIDFLLENNEFSCNFSITSTSPSVGSGIRNGDQVFAQINYQFNNVPAEFEITFQPVLFSEIDQNGSRSGLILNSTESLTIKDLNSNTVNLSGQIDLQRTVSFINHSLFEELELTAIFRRTITEDDLPFFEVGSIVSTNTGIASCDSQASFIVNWSLDQSATPL